MPPPSNAPPSPPRRRLRARPAASPACLTPPEPPPPHPHPNSLLPWPRPPALTAAAPAPGAAGAECACVQRVPFFFLKGVGGWPTLGGCEGCIAHARARVRGRGSPVWRVRACRGAGMGHCGEVAGGCTWRLRGGRASPRPASPAFISHWRGLKVLLQYFKIEWGGVFPSFLTLSWRCLKYFVASSKP